MGACVHVLDFETPVATLLCCGDAAIEHSLQHLPLLHVFLLSEFS